MICGTQGPQTVRVIVRMPTPFLDPCSTVIQSSSRKRLQKESVRRAFDCEMGYWNALQVVGVAHQYPFQPSWESKVNFGCGGCRFLCCLWLAGEYLKYPKMNWWMPSTQVWANKSSKFGRAKMEAMSAPWCHCFLSSPADRCDAPADSAKRRWSTQSLPTIPTKKGRGPIRQDWKHM